MYDLFEEQIKMKQLNEYNEKEMIKTDEAETCT